jgi:hypothetical protein
MSAVWTLGGNSSHVAPLIPSEWYQEGRGIRKEETQEREKRRRYKEEEIEGRKR